MLAVDTTLQLLTLSWNILGSTQAMRVICAGLAENRALQHLSLSRNGICDRDVGALADALQDHPTFEELGTQSHPLLPLCTESCDLRGA